MGGVCACRGVTVGVAVRSPFNTHVTVGSRPPAMLGGVYEQASERGLWLSRSRMRIMNRGAASRREGRPRAGRNENDGPRDVVPAMSGGESDQRRCVIGKLEISEECGQGGDLSGGMSMNYD
jgi:hypothetical protein